MLEDCLVPPSQNATIPESENFLDGSSLSADITTPYRHSVYVDDPQISTVYRHICL